MVCYPVFDLDRHKEDESQQHRRAETQILRAIGSADEKPTVGVHDQYACWEHNITKTFSAELGEAYSDLLETSASKYGYPQPSKAKKVAVVITDVLDTAAQTENESPSLLELASQIASMVDEPL